MEFIARGFPCRPLEGLNEIREIRIEMLGMIFGYESDALLPTPARGRDYAALHSGNDRETGPNFGVTIK
jgi:hypothetical protein